LSRSGLFGLKIQASATGNDITASSTFDETEFGTGEFGFGIYNYINFGNAGSLGRYQLRFDGLDNCDLKSTVPFANSDAKFVRIGVQKILHKLFSRSFGTKMFQISYSFDILGYSIVFLHNIDRTLIQK